MDSKKTFVAIVALVVVFFFGFNIYSYNVQFQQEQLQHQLQVDSTKQTQQRLTQDFITGQQIRGAEQEQRQQDQMQEDSDGDGLSYQEEVNLGTSDNDVDSDGDGIWDNEDRHPAGGGKTHTITVHWTHNHQSYATQFGIHEDKYYYYKDYSRENYYYQDGRFATPNDLTIQTIAKDVTDVSLTTGDTNKAKIAINFVKSMLYQYDIDYIRRSDYPKFPIETIIDERGDCEDTSFLMASILEALGYDTVLLLFLEDVETGHAAVGVWCAGCTGTYYPYNGKNYYFLETTGYADNWEIGRSWGEYTDAVPRIVDV